jgi:hypothetical protein
MRGLILLIYLHLIWHPIPLKIQPLVYTSPPENDLVLRDLIQILPLYIVRWRALHVTAFHIKAVESKIMMLLIRWVPLRLML